jgi:hypothetical protein
MHAFKLVLRAAEAFAEFDGIGEILLISGCPYTGENG